MTDLTGKTNTEISDLIKTWREDESGVGIEAAFDLLNAIDKWLLGTVMTKHFKVFRVNDHEVLCKCSQDEDGEPAFDLTLPCDGFVYSTQFSFKDEATRDAQFAEISQSLVENSVADALEMEARMLQEQSAK